MSTLSYIKKIIFWNSTARVQRERMINEIDETEWRKLGCPLPPPAKVKQNAIRDFGKANGCNELIETGTFMGDTVFALKDDFIKITTIELDKKLAWNASKRFKELSYVNVIQGDSGKILKEILPKMNNGHNLLFWLDGHYSGGVTSKSDKNTPIIDELISIFSHVPDSTIIIDDARLFDGTMDYPSIVEIQNLISSYNLLLDLNIKDDMIFISK